MSQNKRKSEFIQPVIGNLNKAQNEKRSSLRESSRDQTASLSQNISKEITKPSSEGKNSNNQSGLSSRTRQDDTSIGANAGKRTTRESLNHALEQLQQLSSAIQHSKRDSNSGILTPVSKEQMRVEDEDLSTEKRLESGAKDQRRSLVSKNQSSDEGQSRTHEETKSMSKSRLSKDSGKEYIPEEEEVEQEEQIEEESYEETEERINSSEQAPEDEIAHAGTELKNSADRLTIKTFITLRNISKPSEATVKAFHALLCLFADIEWHSLKNYLQSPIYLVGQIQTFNQSCQEGRIPIQNMSRANSLVSTIDPSQAKEIELYNTIIGFVCAALEYWRKASCSSDVQTHQQPKPAHFGSQQRKNSASSKKENTAPVSHRESERDKFLISPMKVQAEPERSRTSSMSYQTPLRDSIRVIDTNRFPSGSSVLDRFEHISTRSPIKYDEKMLKEPAISGITPKKKLEKPNLAKNILRLPQNHLAERLNQAKEEITNRRSYSNTVRTYRRPEDQQFAAEIAERAQIQEDTQNYKKLAREFRQMTTKLLSEEGKKLQTQAKLKEEAELQYDREYEIMEKIRLDGYLDKKKVEEKNHELDIYQERQDSRKQEKVLKKEIDEDYLYHELEQNLLHHYNKAEQELDKKIDRQKVLEMRLEKMQIDRIFKKRQHRIALQQQAKENIEIRDRELHWKKLEALNDRIEAEKEYRLVEKLLVD